MTKFNPISVYFFCAFFVLTASCNRKTTKITETTTNAPVVPTTPTVPIAPKTTDDATAYVVLSISRTACYGNCPVYEAKLMSNGKAYYNGMRAVDRIGTYETVVDAERLAELWKNIAQVKYFDFAAKYPTDEKYQIADLPSCITFVNDGKQSKTINNNNEAPANLQWIEHEIDTFFEHCTWKGRQ
jgi:Domain of unknown function (DUF6438)